MGARGAGGERAGVRDGNRDYQCLALRGVAIDVRIGLNESERQAPQPVVIDVELYRGGGPFHPSGIAECLDYDRVWRHLTGTLPDRPHTDLLEVLAEELVAFCLDDPQVEACRVVIKKPAIYGGRACPEIELYRRR